MPPLEDAELVRNPRFIPSIRAEDCPALTQLQHDHLVDEQLFGGRPSNGEPMANVATRKIAIAAASASRFIASSGDQPMSAFLARCGSDRTARSAPTPSKDARSACPLYNV